MQGDYENKISRLKEIVDNSKKIVFFGGAGVSTESGVPDFRSENGLWNAKTRFNMMPEEIVSHSFFVKRTDDFFEYYMQNLIFTGVEPNATHYALAELERQGKLRAVVTQNIDGLHQAAGNTEVYELHGTIAKSHCMDCGREYDLDYTLDKSHWKPGTWTPLCEKCGGIVKPDVVLYEEALNDECLMGALRAISEADTLIVGGTSLVVYPAAGLINYFKGDNLVLINKQETQYDNQADLVIHESLGRVFAAVVDGIEFSEKPVKLADSNVSAADPANGEE